MGAVLANGAADNERVGFGPGGRGLAEDEIGRADTAFGELHIALWQVRVIESGHGNFRVEKPEIVQHIATALDRSVRGARGERLIRCAA